jgi:hypothetical protein
VQVYRDHGININIVQLAEVDEVILIMIHHDRYMARSDNCLGGCKERVGWDGNAAVLGERRRPQR